jgi:fermentation-respiration switch protein FrsA (DUF1100 family)
MAAAGWIGSHWAMHPLPRPVNYSLADFGWADEAEEVTFPSLDGTPLSGWFIPSPNAQGRTVILLHGYGNTRLEMLPHADYLSRTGLNVLLFDFRGRGASGGKRVTAGLREPLDVRGAVSYLLTREDVDPGRIAVQGVSMGAAAGIMATAEDTRIATIVAESAFTDLRATIDRSFEQFVYLPRIFKPATVRITELRLGGRIDDIRPVEAITRIGQRPVFIIDSLADQLIPSGSGLRLHELAEGPKVLWLIDGSGHSGGWKTSPDEYRARVLEFYDTYLPAGEGGSQRIDADRVG